MSVIIASQRLLEFRLKEVQVWLENYCYSVSEYNELLQTVDKLCMFSESHLVRLVH